MAEIDRARLEAALSRHYAGQRENVAAEAIDTLATAMVAEDARGDKAAGKAPWEYVQAREAQRASRGHAAFVAAQVRYIPTWTWAAQIALVALMGALATTAGDTGATRLAVGMLSAIAVLVGVPTVQASKLHGVAELEYACPHNAASVLVARLIVLGCSSALAVSLMVAATAASANIGAFEAVLWAAPPYFLSCAGSLMALRLAHPSTAMALCAVWTLTCCGALAVFAGTLPNLYAHTSLAVWACAAAVAGAWLIREIAMTCRAATAGLDAFAPHLAKTRN